MATYLREKVCRNMRSEDAVPPLASGLARGYRIHGMVVGATTGYNTASFWGVTACTALTCLLCPDG
jgi:hypothetical protein